MNPKLVCLVGFPGAGKSSICEQLSAKSEINWIRSREILDKMETTDNYHSLHDKGALFFEADQSKAFIQRVLSKTILERMNVFDSLRPISHWRLLSEYFPGGASLVAVDVDAELRTGRLVARDGQAKAIERLNHPVEREIPALMDLAEYRIENNTTVAAAVRNLSEVLRQISTEQ